MDGVGGALQVLQQNRVQQFGILQNFDAVVVGNNREGVAQPQLQQPVVDGDICAAQRGLRLARGRQHAHHQRNDMAADVLADVVVLATERFPTAPDEDVDDQTDEREAEHEEQPRNG